MSRIARRIAGIGASDLPNAAAFDAYVGPAREITVDHHRGIIALHDGETPGGKQFDGLLDGHSANYFATAEQGNKADSAIQPNALAEIIEIITDDIESKVPLAGGTLTGPLTLSGPPTSDLHAVTRSHLRERVATVWPEDFGAVSGSGLTGTQRTANTVALRSFLRYIMENRLKGYMPGEVYEVDGTVFPSGLSTLNPVVLLLDGAPAGTKINYFGPAVANVLHARGYNIWRALLTSIEVDGGDKAYSGIRLSSTYGKAEMVALRCRAKNLRTSNWTVINSHASGISFYIEAAAAEYGGLCVVEECEVDTMLKNSQSAEPNSLANQGIVIVGFQRFAVRRCKVNNIRTDDVVKVDADGIVVFSRFVGGRYRQMVGEVAYNQVDNCAGRFIKLQGDGTVIVHHNNHKIDVAIELLSSFRGVDSQIGSCVVEDNDFVFNDLWTGGDGACLVTLQSPYSQPTATGRTLQTCRRNRLQTSKEWQEFIIPNFNSQENSTEWIIEDNKAEWVGAGIARALNLFSGIRYPATSTKKFAARYRRNDVDAFSFLLQIATSGAGDKSDMLELDIEDNINRSGINFIFSTSGNCWNSNLRVRGNDMGGTSGASLVHTNLDLARLRPGCAFRIGAGIITNGRAANMSNNFLEKLDRQYMRTWTGTALYHSIDNGAVWTLPNYTPPTP